MKIKTSSKNESDYLVKRINGLKGQMVLKNKLKNQDYRKKFLKNLGLAVSNGIREKMKDNPEFRRKWVEKCKLATKKAKMKRRELLENDLKFREKWIKNCSKGGTSSYINKKGIYDKKYAKARLYGSLKGLKNTGRKVKGPLGEDMYNILERDVAKTILFNKLNYIYEKVFLHDNLNGHISCDFIINFKNPLFIEVTCWDKIKDKSKELNRKFSIFKKYASNLKGVVITTRMHLRDKYRKYINKEIEVLTIKEFKDNFKMIAG